MRDHLTLISPRCKSHIIPPHFQFLLINISLLGAQTTGQMIITLIKYNHLSIFFHSDEDFKFKTEKYNSNLSNSTFKMRSTKTIIIYIFYTCVCIRIYPTSSLQAKYDTRSIFKRSFTTLNSVFLSPRRVAIPRLKRPVCPSIDS